MSSSLAEKVATGSSSTATSTFEKVFVNELVSLLIGREWIIVIVDRHPVMRYRKNDNQTRKSVVVQLLSVELVTVKEAIEAFHIARSTLYDAWHDFNQDGIVGLVPTKSGPKEPWKLVPHTRRLLLDTVYAHPNWKIPQITVEVNLKLKQEELPPLSNLHVRRFLTSCGILPRLKMRTSFTDEQLQIPLEVSQTVSSSENRPTTKSLPKIEVMSQVEPLIAADEQSVAQSERLRLNNLSWGAGEQRYIKQLQAGINSTFGGGFLMIPFLNSTQFAQLIARELALIPQGYYSTLQVSLTFFYLALFGMASLEMVKMIPKAELGLLIGKARSPGLSKLRDFIAMVASLKLASDFALASACHQIQAGVVDWQVLFIDGHFIPYYGRRRIRKGYFTTHRMALKGNQAYYANDYRGRPFFFLLVEASTSLTSILPLMVQRVRQIVGGLWADWCLTTVFDRGGFSAQLFKKLDELKVYWITWLKTSPKISVKVYLIEEDKFKLYLLRLKKSKVKVKLYEWQVPITDYGECRAIVLLDTKSKKRMVIITNDKKRSLSEIAEILLNRWSQENFFKMMLARYYLDYVPGYQFEEASSEPQVDNPRIKELRSLKKRLIAMKRKLESELSQKLLARKREQVSLQSYKRSHQKRIRAIAGLTREIERVASQLAQTPKKISLNQAWEEKHEVANLERKEFFDAIKLLAFNAEEYLLEQFSPYYQGKDVRQALLQIIFRGTVVQLVEGVLHVRLKSFDSPKIQAAAEALCIKLNAEKVVTLDKFQFPIVYEVLLSL